jgi:DNA-binding transcriptional LysR family regulator
MELRHLRYFIAVAEEGSITRAAERLDMQQPPLSQQIKAIERELDVQLFRRRAHGVELTDAGRTLLEEARAIITNIDHAVETTRRTARGEQGQICVGVTPTGPFYPFVPRVIRAFREAYPGVFLTLEESPSPELVDRLRDEQIDAAFLRTPIADTEGLRIDPLLEEPMVVALPNGHVLAQSQRGRDMALSVRDLAGETFIVYGRPHKPGQHGLGQYEAMIAACHAAGFSPRIGQEAPRVTSLLALVATGAGITLVPASLQQMHIDGVMYRPIDGRPQPKVVLNLVSRRGDPSAVVRRFLNLVKQAAKNFVPDETCRSSRKKTF